MVSVADKFAEYSQDPPAINMTEKDFKLDESDIAALDTNFQLDSYG